MYFWGVSPEGFSATMHITFISAMRLHDAYARRSASFKNQKNNPQEENKFFASD